MLYAEEQCFQMRAYLKILRGLPSENYQPNSFRLFFCYICNLSYMVDPLNTKIEFDSVDEDFENAQWCGNVKLQTIENVCAGLHISGSIVIG